MTKCKCFSADMGYHLDSCEFTNDKVKKNTPLKQKEVKQKKFKKMKMKKNKVYSNTCVPMEKL